MPTKKKPTRPKQTNRDPLVDRCCQVIQWAIDDGVPLKTIAERSEVAAITIYFWLKGLTRSPGVEKLARVMRAIDTELMLNTKDFTVRSTRRRAK
jgi:hypothetical protein